MMSEDFSNRLNPILSGIVREFGTPFHIYDEVGIRKTVSKFPGLPWQWYGGPGDDKGFKNFFAVKACPNPRILKLMLDFCNPIGAGKMSMDSFGFDCSSIAELEMVRSIGARGEQIMFTSNNTSAEELKAALANGGCILNLDDVTLIDKVEDFPALICFRYNPGNTRQGNSIIGNPEEAKYGMSYGQLIEAYRLAQKFGARRFGLHTMICSNQLDYKYIVETTKMLLNVAERIKSTLGITMEFINIGGGVGIPYRPEQEAFNFSEFASGVGMAFSDFQKRNKYSPRLFMECGRCITGPHGVLVTTVINRLSKYREYVGVDACMSSLMRPALYDAYHHITILNSAGRELEKVDVVGSLCENNDKFAKDRELPKVEEGDIMIIHDTGAHGYAMGFNYNGRLRPKELLLCANGDVKLIRRAETIDDYFATLRFPEHIELKSSKK